MKRSFRLVSILLTLLFFVTSWGWSLGTFPKVGEYEVLRGDFHMHTVSSDGKVTARERIDGQKKRDIDTLAITDHWNTKALRFAMQYAPTVGIVPVRGLETGLPAAGLKQHLVALGFEPLYSPKDPHNWSPVPNTDKAYYRDEMIKLKNAGGLLLMAHPAPDSLTEAMLWGIDQGIIQGVEVVNGKTFRSHSFDWALKYNLAVFANSDAHRAPSPAYTLVFVNRKTTEGVMDAIRARRTVALCEGTFWGRENLLSMLINTMIKVRLEDENGSKYAVFENSGPVAMKGVITGATEQPLEITANSKTRIPWTGEKTISVRWENAYISSKDKLTTTFNLTK